jgi:hypothetical protein
MVARWTDGCKYLLPVNAIFAGFSGALVVAAISTLRDKVGSVLIFDLPAASVTAFVALWLFAFTGERLSDALEEREVETYLTAMRSYNVGVLFILVSLCFIVWPMNRCAAILVGLIWVYPWGKDLWFLLWQRGKEWEKYYQNLLGPLDP